MTTFFSRILVTLINVPISVLVARTLGTEGQGGYSAVLTFSTLWGTSFLLGIDTAHTYLLAGKRYTLRQIVRHSWIWSLILGAAATPVYWWVAPWLAGDDSSVFRSVLTLSALSVPLVMAKYLMLSMFLGEGRVDRFNLLQVVSNIALLALVVVLLLVFPGGIREAVWAYIASLVVFVILGGVWVAERLREHQEEPEPVGWNPELAKSSVVYGLKGHLGTLVTAMTYRLDQLLVTKMLGLEAQGLYSIAVLLSEKLSHIPASIQLILFPRISASTAEDANRLTPVACRLAFFGVLGAALPLFLLSEPLVRLFYGHDFLPCLPSLRVLLPGVVLLAVGKILAGDLSGRNRRGTATVAMTFAFLLNFALDLWWIPRYGIIGAAWATNAAYTAQTLMLALVFWRISGIGPWKLFVPERADAHRVRRVLKGLARSAHVPRTPSERRKV